MRSVNPQRDKAIKFATESIGHKFNLLTILAIAERPSHITTPGIYVRVLCDCGNECVRLFSAIRGLKTRSCGCLSSNRGWEDKARKLTKEMEAKAFTAQSPKALEELNLIAEGYLPSADSFVHDGSPAFTLDTIVTLLGATRDEVLATLRQGRFIKEPPSENGADYRVVA